MDNVIVKQTSDYKFTEFFSSFQNYVPATYYNEQWYIEMKKIVNTINKNNLQQQFSFTDRRLILLAYKALEKVNTEGNENEWFIVKNYFDTYSGKTDSYSKDIREFIDMYIGYTYTSSEKDEKATKKEEKLKSVLVDSIESGVLSLPLFVKNEIVGKVEMATKPDIEFAPEPPEDVSFDQEAAKKEIETQLMFAQMMLEGSKTQEEFEEWSKAIQMLQLLSN